MLPLVLRTTTGAPVVQQVTSGPAEVAGQVRAFVQVRCLPASVSVRILHGGQPLQEWKEGASRMEETLELPLTEDRTEIELEVKWPAGTDTGVAEVRLEPDGLSSWSGTVWADGAETTETLSVSWRKGDAP